MWSERLNGVPVTEMAGQPVLLTTVTPGGTLLVAGHAISATHHAREHGFHAAEYVQPSDITALLDDGWEMPVDETRPRATPPPDSDPVVRRGEPCGVALL